MSRNSSGTYTLPSGNPVVSGTLIEANWANTTLSDLATAMTDSLSRSGQGGMTAAFRAYDGTSTVPGIAWGSETTTGFYRAGAGDTRLVITGSEVMKYLATGVTITGTLGVSGAITATGGVTGNASTATALQTARTIWGQSFDGTANVTGALTGVTDLTASGNVTLSGGTANGVPYLNGSKVLTSGSALTFDGTSLVVGGTASPNYKLASYVASGNNGITIGNGSNTGTDYAALDFYMASAQKAVIYANNNNLTINSSAGSTIFQTSSSEQMRLTSTGLGIGTSSPSSKLHLSSAANTRGIAQNTNAAGSAGGVYWDMQSAAATAGSAWYRAVRGLDESGNLRWAIGQYGAPEDTIGFYTGTSGTERMRLDSSGNLGLGVTPSGWGGAAKAIDITGFGSVGGSTGFQATTNSYFNGTSWIYKNTATAALYTQNTGAHAWYTAPSGTAGNAITFTQAMTLDASGNLGVGSTSPVTRLSVVSPTATSSTLDAVFNVTNDIDANFRVYVTGSGVTDKRAAIGTTTTTPLTFVTGVGGSPIERARIDSSGNFMVGTATQRGVGGITLTPNTSNGAGEIAFNRNSTTSTSYVVGFQNAGSTVGYIAYTNSTVTYNTGSDARLKDNVAPAADSGAIVDAIEIVQHDWKSGGHADFSVIAQDLHQVFPQAVTPGDDGEQITQTWGVDYSKLVPLLVKEIQSLRARVTTLEAA